MEARKLIKVDVYLTPMHLEEMHLKDKNVVVIDVLRASSTVAAALKNGAKEIIPVNSVESVVKISSSLYGDVTLRAGERNGRMIEGFNLGNSPLEYSKEIVKGKSIILLTTNGSAAMVKGRYAKNLIVAGFVNLSTVVEFLNGLASDFIIICAGKEHRFCIEDTVCAGKIINRLREKLVNDELVTDDAGIAAAALDKAAGKNILAMLKGSEHGRYLTEIGFGADLKVCGGLDSIPILPLLSGNVIRLLEFNIKRSA